MVCALWEDPMHSLQRYTLLGRSGLRVSPLCLGTMNFGTEWGWGHDAETARKIFQRYIELGGNFIDTADGYTGGTSEQLLGQFIEERSLRDRVVLATKFTFTGEMGNPNAGGNGRKNMIRALEGSLKRLRTDYVDLYWLHAWDMLTPVEEVMSGLDALVRAGKVRYIGFSDTPAWYTSRAQTLADLRGWEKICALQFEYNLTERSVEREHVPMALELGMGLCPWSPLASGLLTGKYRRTSGGVEGKGRLQTTKDSTNPVFKKFSDRNFAIVDELVQVAERVGKSPAQVALNWITKRPGVTSTIVGASSIAQLDDNLSALDFTLPESEAAKLEKASRPEPVTPYIFFESEIQSVIKGGTQVKREPEWFRKEGPNA